MSSDRQTNLQKIIHFPLTKIIVGIAVVVGLVLFAEWIRKSFLDPTALSDDMKNLIIGLAEVVLSLSGYILLFRWYEKRPIRELAWRAFGKNAIAGCTAGFVLQSLVIGVIYFFGTYTVQHINPLSFLISAFAFAIVAGVVMEVLLRGIVFRLVEAQLGTGLAIFISALIFAIAHGGSGLLPMLATVAQAGLLISAGYVYTRSLWFPIGFHFAWDFAEPGIYGGINPGISTGKTLLTSTIGGPAWLTGGPAGPGNSLPALLFCLIAAIWLLRMAKKRDKFVRPFWKK